MNSYFSLYRGDLLGPNRKFVVIDLSDTQLLKRMLAFRKGFVLGLCSRFGGSKYRILIYLWNFSFLTWPFTQILGFLKSWIWNVVFLSGWCPSVGYMWEITGMPFRLVCLSPCIKAYFKCDLWMWHKLVVWLKTTKIVEFTWWPCLLSYKGGQ